jgi:hypothetical protein
MGKLTMPAVNNSQAKPLGIALDLDEITKAEPFASLFDIHAEILEAIKADMAEHGFDPSKPVNVWRKEDGSRVLIDGYTRVRAAEELGLPSVFAYVKAFKDEDEALAYAVHTQKDRRNLSDAELFRLLERLDKPVRGFKGAPATIAENPIGKASAPIPANAGNGGGKRETSALTAELAGTSKAKVERFRSVLSDPEEAAAVRSGAKTINQAAETVKAKRSKPSSPRTGKPAPRKPEARDQAAEALASLVSASDLHKLEKLAQAEGKTAEALARRVLQGFIRTGGKA